MEPNINDFWYQIVKEFIENGMWSIDRGGDFNAEIKIRNCNFTGIVLDNCRLANVTFIRCKFGEGTTLPWSLDRANFRHCDLSGMNLEGYRVSVNTFHLCHSIIGPIMRHNDAYVFYAVSQLQEPYRVMAGCRWLTDKEYRNHIKYYGWDEKAEETESILNHIKLIAKQRQWVVE